jgi:hypothetical protein
MIRGSRAPHDRQKMNALPAYLPHPAAVHVVRVDPQRLVHAPHPHLPPLRRRLRLCAWGHRKPLGCIRTASSSLRVQAIIVGMSVPAPMSRGGGENSASHLTENVPTVGSDHIGSDLQ